MDRGLAAKHAAAALDGAVSNYLIDVHVGLGAGTRLPDPQRKFAIKGTAGHLLGNGRDELGQRGIENPHGGIGLSAGRFEQAQGMDDGQGHGLTEGEKPQGTLGLGSPVMLGGNADQAQTVLLQAGGRAGSGGGHRASGRISLLSSLKLTMEPPPFPGARGIPVALLTTVFKAERSTGPV